MSSKTIYHTTYLIEDICPEHLTKRFYHGVHSSELHPDDDPYMGSSLSTSFKSQLKQRPSDFIKYTLSYHNTRDDACEAEVSYHKRFDVASNPLYWNKLNATDGLDTQGHFTARNVKTGETALMPVGTKGDWVANSKDMVCVIDLSQRGRSYRVTRDEYVDSPWLMSISFEGVRIAPWGNFSGVQEMSDNCPTRISTEFCKRITKDHNRVVSHLQVNMNHYIEEEHIGLTYRGMGFDFVPYEKGDNEALMCELLCIDVNDVPKHSKVVEIERKERASKIGIRSNIKRLVMTPWGVNTMRHFKDNGLSMLLKVIGNNSYGNLSDALGVTDWKGAGYYIGDTSQKITELEQPDIFNDIRELDSLLSMQYRAFRGVYMTPKGSTLTVKEGEKLMNGKLALAHIYRNRLDVVVTKQAVDRSSYLNDECVGKTWRQLGFDLIPYEPGVNEKAMIGHIKRLPH